MISQASRHRRSAEQPFSLWIILYFSSQAFVRANPIVVSIFPSDSIFVRLGIFRESQGFAGQACIEDPCGQIAAFDISRTFAQEPDQFRFGAPNGFQFHALKTSMFIALFNHLQIEPVFSGLRSGGWTTPSAIFRDDPINLQHCIINPAPTIGDQGRRSIWMSTLLKHLKGFFAGFSLILAHSTGDTQPTVNIQHRRDPERAAFICLWVAFFRPYWPRRTTSRPVEHV